MPILNQTSQSVIQIATVIGACGTLGGVFYGFHKILKKFEKIETGGELRKAENKMLIKSTFALCDGLMQLGANGQVSTTRQELQDFIIGTKE